uniref:Putative RNase_H superfamily protein n=1 Tax=viral metagenome TaxID=1070528 RepID=A0A6H1ZTM4_9ZZZZ
MAKAPVSKLKKKEIIWLSKNLCQAHSMDYLSHYNCYLKEIVKNPDYEHVHGTNMPMLNKIGFLDIENFGFQADFGIMLSYCILDDESKTILGRPITKRELATCGDEKLVKDCVRDMSKFDKLVGFYSSRHDIPYIRTRATFHKIPFPRHGEIIHQDLYFAVKYKFRLSRSSQQTAYNILVGESHKTYWGRDNWIKALRGDKKSLDYIYTHNQIDVQELRELYYAIEHFTMRSDRSM